MKLSDLYDETSPESLENYAKGLMGHTVQEVLSWDIPSKIDDDLEVESSVGESMSPYLLPKKKGGVGNLIEEQYFCYKANSDSQADFPKAGVELKVTPYEIKRGNRMSAGERLVLSMISYKDPVEPQFEKSHVWDKCKLILLIYYLRDKNRISEDYRFDFVKLFTPPPNDLEIIKQDYRIIIEKVKAGKAHELSEADTMYLGACTKGATAEKSTVPQAYYNPDIPARRRAFCFKTKYMTYVLNNYIAADVDTYESIITEESELQHSTFEQIITDRINQYVGKTDKELCDIFDREYNNNKSQWSDLAFRMLGVKSNKAAEFEKAQIVVKAIRIEEDGKMKESISLPTINFLDLVQENWEESVLHNYFDETKFFFVVYKKSGSHYILQGSMLWNMPTSDLDYIVREGWEKVRQTVSSGIEFTIKEQKNGIIIMNNLPEKKDNQIIHIRPHASKSYYVLEDGLTYGSGKISDSDILPDGRRMTKQSFWLNNEYIINVLQEGIK